MKIIKSVMLLVLTIVLVSIIGCGGNAVTQPAGDGTEIVITDDAGRRVKLTILRAPLSSRTVT